MAKCNLGKVKLQANAVSSLLLKRTWSEGCPQGPFAYLVTYVASRAGILSWSLRICCLANRCGSLHWIPRWSFLTYSLCDWILVSLGFMTTQWFDSRWYNLKLIRQQHVIAMVIIRDIHLIKTGWKPLEFWQSRLTLKLITRLSAIQVLFSQTNY